MSMFNSKVITDLNLEQFHRPEYKLPWFASPDYLRYSVAYLQDNIVCNLHQVVFKNGTPIGFLPFVILEHSGNLHIASFTSVASHYAPNLAAPISFSNDKKIQKELAEFSLDQISNYQEKYNIPNFQMEFHTQKTDMNALETYISRKADANTLSEYYVRTLGPDKPSRRFSKNISRDISTGEKKLALYISTKNDVSCAEHFNDYRTLHGILAGNTRSAESWELQYEALINGSAFLSSAYLSGEHVGTGFYFCGVNDAYYQSGAYRRDLPKLAITHCCLNNAMTFLESKNFQTLVLSHVPNDLSILSEKERSILFFKSRMASNVRAHRVYSFTKNFC